MSLTLERRSAQVLRAMRDGGGIATRAELTEATGLARATLADHLETMLATGLIIDVEPAPSSGGRKAQRLAINPDAARIAVIDVGGSRTLVGLADFRGDLLGHQIIALPVEAGPTAVLTAAKQGLHELMGEHGGSDRLMVAVGLPGPVDFATGYVVSPPIMVGWEGVDIAADLRAAFAAPVIIDNDVNLIALAEQRIAHPDSEVMLVAKLGTGIGGGIVINGEVLRGARGAAGDIGHTQASPPSTHQCRCGHVGCVEAEAGGWALVNRLQAEGLDVRSVSEVAASAREGNPHAVAAVRHAMRIIGSALADAVSLLNPDTVVLAGELMGAGEQVIAMLRESVYQWSLPLATHELQLTQGTVGSTAGLHGGALLAISVLLQDFSPRQPMALP